MRNVKRDSRRPLRSPTPRARRSSARARSSTSAAGEAPALVIRIVRVTQYGPYTQAPPVVMSLTGRPASRVAVRVTDVFAVVSLVGVTEHFESGQR